MAKIKVPSFTHKNGFMPSEKGSLNLRKVKSTDTKAEIMLRKAIWSQGYRYRINQKSLPGKPDIVFSQKKLVIFVDGDFWHGFNWHVRKPRMKTNTGYWIPKIERNIQRDREITLQLEELGWTVLRIWEHEVYKDMERCVEKITALLNDIK